jgi:hypothetical protein
LSAQMSAGEVHLGGAGAQEQPVAHSFGGSKYAFCDSVSAQRERQCH